MSSDKQGADIRQWLADRGHSAAETDAILAKLGRYDAQVVRDSIFYSIDTGDFDIDQVIKEALADDDSGEA